MCAPLKNHNGKPYRVVIGLPIHMVHCSAFRVSKKRIDAVEFDAGALLRNLVARKPEKRTPGQLRASF